MISGSYVAALHVTYLLSDGSTRQFRHGRPATVTSTQTIDFDESEVLIGIDGSVMDDQILYCTFEVQDIRSKMIRQITSMYEDSVQPAIWNTVRRRRF
ncbi:hypothetical protein BD410DRAFT_120424 [Rickenella mellea]|uniref:Uncharacterized protein n=1 Tax=Rickenella mellea TaxID=50990 RepID=A0A4Y7PLW6_9AGAM|nr:hypothetical protein BD410DRAFT_120424 [Rickenella mellea]